MLELSCQDHCAFAGEKSRDPGYDGKALAKELPFDQLADDATQRTKLIEYVKAVVKRVKESPFGYCGITQVEWNRLIPIIQL